MVDEDVRPLTENVMRRIRAFQQNNPAPALEGEALSDAAALLRDSGEQGERSMNGLYAVAWLHWCRYQALPDDRRAPDLETARRLFRPIVVHDPLKVPAALHAEFGIDGTDDTAQRVSSHLEVLRKAVIAEDAQAVDGLIGASIDMMRQLPPTRAGVAALWSMVALGYHVRFRQTSSRDRLELMLDAARRAASTPNLPGHAAALDVLAQALKLRSTVAGDLGNADEHIATLRRRIARFPADDASGGRTKRLQELAAAHSARFNRADQTAPVTDQDVVLLRDLVHQTPSTAPLPRALYLSVLGVVLRGRYERSEAPANIHESIDALRAAVNTSAPDEPRKAAYLAALAVSLRLRHTDLGAPVDLDEAINASRAAAQPDPSQGRIRAYVGLSAPPMPTLQYRLADALNTRAATMTDLDEAIFVLGAALRATPPGPTRETGQCGSRRYGASVREPDAPPPTRLIERPRAAAGVSRA